MVSPLLWPLHLFSALFYVLITIRYPPFESLGTLAIIYVILLLMTRLTLDYELHKGKVGVWFLFTIISSGLSIQDAFRKYVLNR